MKPILFASLLTLLPLALVAQDHQPLEKAQKAARLLVEKAPPFADAQIKTSVDAEKPYLLTGNNNVGGLVIPDKSLKNKEPLKLEDKPTPIGQLWMRGLAPSVDGSTIPTDKLREVAISTDNEDVKVTAYLLAVKKDGDAPVLLVYGKPKAPIATLTLKAAKTLQELPLELDAIGDGGSATLYFNVAGQYIAEMKIVPLER